MMYLEVLIISLAAAVAHAAVLPVAGDVCAAATVSGYSVGVMSFLDLFGSSFSAQLKAAIFKRQNDAATHQHTAGDDVMMVFIIFSIGLELFIITFAVWFGLYLCIRRCLDSRAPQNNPERERADRVLNSHPQQPGDIELGVMHPRPQSEWPLTGHHMEMGSAEPEPDTSHNSNSVNVHTRPDTPLPYITHYGSGKTTNSEAGNPREDTEC